MTKESKIQHQEESLTFFSEKFNVEVYNDIAKSGKLMDVRLCESKYYISPKFIPKTMTENDFSFLGEGSIKSIYFFKDEGFLSGVYEWKSKIRYETKIAISITAKYNLAYRGLKNKDDKHVNLFFQKLARFTSYPYFRAHVGLLSAEAGILIPPLPSLLDRVD